MDIFVEPKFLGQQVCGYAQKRGIYENMYSIYCFVFPFEWDKWFSKPADFSG